MTEPADPVFPAPVPVVALQYERRDATDPRAGRGIAWLAAALLLIAAQPLILSLLERFGALGRGQSFMYPWVAAWFAMRTIALVACWMLIPSRASLTLECPQPPLRG